LSTSYIDNESKERPWQASDIVAVTRSGIRSWCKAFFIPDSVIQTELGVLPEEVPGIQRHFDRNEKMEVVSGIAVAPGGIPAKFMLHAKDVESFTETTVEMMHQELPHGRTIRPDRMKLEARQMHTNLPANLQSDNLKLQQTWQDVVQKFDLIQKERAAAAAARSAGSAGSSGGVVSASILRQGAQQQDTLWAPPAPTAAPRQPKGVGLNKATSRAAGGQAVPPVARSTSAVSMAAPSVAGSSGGLRLTSATLQSMAGSVAAPSLYGGSVGGPRNPAESVVGGAEGSVVSGRVPSVACSRVVPGGVHGDAFEDLAAVVFFLMFF
jgi:hypothetical protein